MLEVLDLLNHVDWLKGQRASVWFWVGLANRPRGLQASAFSFASWHHGTCTAGQPICQTRALESRSGNQHRAPGKPLKLQSISTQSVHGGKGKRSVMMQLADWLNAFITDGRWPSLATCSAYRSPTFLHPSSMSTAASSNML